MGKWTMSLEICPLTLRIQRLLKLHFHLIMEWARRIDLKWVNDCTFLGVRFGHVRTDRADADLDGCERRRVRKLCSASGHFYGQCKKVGMIACDTNHRPLWTSQ